MNRKQIIVIGDTIIDHSVFGETLGLSLETPTIKGKFIEEEYTPGGAGNVVNNLLELGQRVNFITPLVNDDFGNIINNWEDDNLTAIPMASTGQNFVKSRFWLKRGESQYKTLQLNRGAPTSVSQAQVEEILYIIEDIKPDLVMLVDYRCGLFDDPSTSEKIIKLCNKREIKVASSSQTSSNRNRYHYFKNSYLICMNRQEATQISRTFEPNFCELNNLFHLLQSNICVTLGKEGAVCFDGKEVTYEPAHRVNALDPTGAGDSFFAALAYTADNIDLGFCNKWAAASTLKVGTNVPTKEDLDAID